MVGVWDTGQNADDQDAKEGQRLAGEVDGSPAEVREEEPGEQDAEEAEGELGQREGEGVGGVEAGLFVC